MPRRSARNIAQGGRPSGVRANFTAPIQVQHQGPQTAAEKRLQLGRYISNGDVENVNAMRRQNTSKRFIQADFKEPVTSNGKRLLEHALIKAAKHGVVHNGNYTNSGLILDTVLSDFQHLNNTSRSNIPLFRKDAPTIMHAVMGVAKNSQTRKDIVNILLKYGVNARTLMSRHVDSLEVGEMRGQGTPLNVLHLLRNHNTANHIKKILALNHVSEYNTRSKNNGRYTHKKNEAVNNLTKMLRGVRIPNTLPYPTLPYPIPNTPAGSGTRRKVYKRTRTN